METQLDRLIEMAGFDGNIVGLQKQLDAIPKAIEARRESYRGAEKNLEEKKKKLADMQKEHRVAEGALDGHLERIRKLNDQQNLVKTNKEYTTLLGEIDNLKKGQDGYEEKILELMEESGGIEQEIRDAKKSVSEAKAAFEEEEARLQLKADKLRKELKVEEAAKAEILPSIDAENLQQYNRIKTIRGDALAEVRDELCLGCRVCVPPQKYAYVIINESIETCSNCSRILYFRNRELSGREAG